MKLATKISEGGKIGLWEFTRLKKTYREEVAALRESP
ncbi:hypothetical protein P3T39_000665 [Kitasatospora sp. GP82]|nr:hypothetical protein [Kitasatospora sp. GP82]